mmetsp:Transcript_65100/g.108153  ORF Transcript_65100/g.108153 Transcript_65100/m.108153 type:complete len:318 (-) Transcript_65100:240-1193(-)
MAAILLLTVCATLLGIYVSLCRLYVRLRRITTPHHHRNNGNLIHRSQSAQISDSVNSTQVYNTVPELAVFGCGNWTLACEIMYPSLLQVFTQYRHGVFSFRFVTELGVGVAECMALAHEADLIPTWNPFCSWARVTRLSGPFELWAHALAAFPWPIPRHRVCIHAKLVDMMHPLGLFVCSTYTPEESECIGGEAPCSSPLPPEVAECSQLLPLKLSVCRLTPHALSPKERPRTSIDLVVQFEPTKVAYLRGATTIPQWILNLVLSVVLPFLWRKLIAVLAEFSSHDTLLARRVATDETGLYRLIHASSKQPLVGSTL